MLDYDSLRSKVRRLTEKPDKDASKLPRTEKELEMVSFDNSLLKASPSATMPVHPAIMALKRKPVKRAHTRTASLATPEHDYSLDFDMPSPPKALNGIATGGERGMKVTPSDTPSKKRERPVSLDLGLSKRRIESPEKSPSLRAWMVHNIKAPRSSFDHDVGFPQRRPSAIRSSSADISHLASCPQVPRKTKADSLDLERSFSHCHPSARNSLSPSKRSSARSASTSKRVNSLQLPSLFSSVSASGSFAATPFFDPSELEDIMRPLREKFVHEETDMLAQAKTAYDQLNDQLSSELPQLIDLRLVLARALDRTGMRGLLNLLGYRTSILHSRRWSKFNSDSAQRRTVGWHRYSSM